MGRQDESAIASGTNGSTRTPGLVAVVSDDSAAPAAVTGSKRQTLAGMLREEAEVITRLSGLTVITKPVGTADDAAKLIEAARPGRPRPGKQAGSDHRCNHPAVVAATADRGRDW